MTRKKSFHDVSILFVKMETKEKERLERIASEKGFSNLSELVRMTLRECATKHEAKNE